MFGLQLLVECRLRILNELCCSTINAASFHSGSLQRRAPMVVGSNGQLLASCFVSYAGCPDRPYSWLRIWQCCFGSGDRTASGPGGLRASCYHLKIFTCWHWVADSAQMSIEFGPDRSGKRALYWFRGAYGHPFNCFWGRHGWSPFLRCLLEGSRFLMIFWHYQQKKVTSSP